MPSFSERVNEHAACGPNHSDFRTTVTGFCSSINFLSTRLEIWSVEGTKKLHKKENQGLDAVKSFPHGSTILWFVCAKKKSHRAGEKGRKEHEK
ncbi:beta-glucuronidase [Anopheles sinensis]|uniref:Beta-glucuronidase n=1 Tax=Anopheles sinensis TaxID=74873 RepID=A0A084VWF0_ANOSI|nr:beta-glucuronidase [Anopheles sinensis]